jgi:hypothetical protein
VLRGLIIDGAGVSGSRGINFGSGASLVVDGCIVRNVANEGLRFSSGGSTNETLAVTNSFFLNSTTSNGIFIVSSGSGNVTASIDRTELSGNSINGLDASAASSTGTVNVAITGSVAANNQHGLVTDGNGTAIVNLTVTDTQILGNSVGVKPFAANTTIWLAHSTIVGNALSFDASVGTINSFLDNYFADNAGSSFMLMPATKQ